jgi:hypothetical protein
MAYSRASFENTVQNRTSRLVCRIFSVLLDLMDNNGKLQFVLLKNVIEYQRFCQRKDAMDTASFCKK